MKHVLASEAKHALTLRCQEVSPKAFSKKCFVLESMRGWDVTDLIVSGVGHFLVLEDFERFNLLLS